MLDIILYKFIGTVFHIMYVYPIVVMNLGLIFQFIMQVYLNKVEFIME